MYLFWLIILLMLTVAASFICYPGIKSSSYKRLFLIIAIIIVPVVSLSLYYLWGDSQELSQMLAWQQHSTQNEKLIANFKQHPQQLVKRLRERLKQEPKSAKGWYLLGKIYLGMTDYRQAEAAFAMANRLKPNDVNIMLELAQASFFKNRMHLNPKAQRLITRILILQHNNPQAINLLAVNAYRAHHYQEALNNWEKLLPYYPANTTEGKELLRAITKTQTLLANT